jgi:hypothetical protein
MTVGWSTRAAELKISNIGYWNWREAVARSLDCPCLCSDILLDPLPWATRVAALTNHQRKWLAENYGLDVCKLNHLIKTAWFTRGNWTAQIIVARWLCSPSTPWRSLDQASSASSAFEDYGQTVGRDLSRPLRMYKGTVINRKRHITFHLSQSNGRSNVSQQATLQWIELQLV